MSQQTREIIAQNLEYAQTYRLPWVRLQPFEHSEKTLGKNHYYLPGWTEDDARKMALALLEGLDKENTERLEQSKQELKQRKENAKQLEKDIVELQDKNQPIDEQLEHYKNTIHYQTIEDARKSIVEWSNLINMIDVDIVGIQAKLEMVGRQREENQKRKNPLRNLTEALFQIEMANKVELAGALARKKAAQASLEKALDFVGLSEEWGQLASSIWVKENKLANEQKAIISIEKTLSDLPAQYKPIEVLDTTVIIYPLK